MQALCGHPGHKAPHNPPYKPPAQGARTRPAQGRPRSEARRMKTERSREGHTFPTSWSIGAILLSRADEPAKSAAQSRVKKTHAKSAAHCKISQKVSYKPSYKLSHKVCEQCLHKAGTNSLRISTYFLSKLMNPLSKSANSLSNHMNSLSKSTDFLRKSANS